MKQIVCLRPPNVNKVKQPLELLEIGRTIQISHLQTLNHSQQTL